MRPQSQAWEIAMHNHDANHDHPAADDRHHGHRAEERHQGVSHRRRRREWQPHPHDDAARHLMSPRGTAPLVERGAVAAYDPAGGTAMVRLMGAPARLIGPTRVTACAPRDLAIVGASCLVALLDPHNPADAVVAALWPAEGGVAGAKLTRAGVVEVGVTGAGAGEGYATVRFPAPYAATPVVVATSTDPAWAATVAGVTPGGFTLVVRPSSPATTGTGPVSAQWMACGV